MDSTERSEKFLQLYYPGDSVATKELRSQIIQANLREKLNRKVFERPVLFEGETGTGKEYAARALCAHWMWLGEEASTQDELLKDPSKLPLFSTGVPDEHFYAVSAADLHGDVGLTELVGCLKGSYTGATKDREGILGSNRSHILIDEISSASPALQGSLLRIVQFRRRRPVGGEVHDERPIGARLMFAVNQVLGDEVRLGRFRRDLYYRLSDSKIRIPALRETKERIRELASVLVRELARGKTVPAAEKCMLTGEDLDWAENQTWLGNVRQLRNVIDNWLSRTLLERREIALRECTTVEGEIHETSSDAAHEIEILRMVVEMMSEDIPIDGFAGFVDRFRKPAAAALYHAFDREIISREVFEHRFGEGVRSVIDQARRLYTEDFARKFSRQ